MDKLEVMVEAVVVEAPRMAQQKALGAAELQVRATAEELKQVLAGEGPVEAALEAKDNQHNQEAVEGFMIMVAMAVLD